MSPARSYAAGIVGVIDVCVCHRRRRRRPTRNHNGVRAKGEEAKEKEDIGGSAWRIITGGGAGGKHAPKESAFSFDSLALCARGGSVGRTEWCWTGSYWRNNSLFFDQSPPTTLCWEDARKGMTTLLICVTEGEGSHLGVGKVSYLSQDLPC